MCVCMCLRICGCIDSFTSSNGVYVSKTDTALPLRTEGKVWVQSKFSLQLTHMELWMAKNRRVVPPWSKEQHLYPCFLSSWLWDSWERGGQSVPCGCF